MDRAACLGRRGFVSFRLDITAVRLLPPEHSGLAVRIPSHSADQRVRIRKSGDGLHNRIQGELDTRKNRVAEVGNAMVAV